MHIKQIQTEIQNWETDRFPHAPSYLALIKVGEELGELDGHYIGRFEQHVGKEPIDHQAGMEDSVADVFISLCVFCTREHIDLDAVTERVWNEVKKRTFVITERGQDHFRQRDTGAGWGPNGNIPV